jgi:hypothetical protein
VAWTSPKTWSFGEILTSTDMNTYVRDNTQALFNRGVVQVVQTTKTDTYSASVGIGASTGNVTGLTPSITPESVDSKVLVIVQLSASLNPADRAVSATLFRSTTPIYVGDTSGSIRSVSSGVAPGSDRAAVALSIVYLDSPATTSATQYSVRLSHTNSATATVYVNRGNDFSDNNQRHASASSITLVEVAL